MNSRVQTNHIRRELLVIWLFLYRVKALALAVPSVGMSGYHVQHTAENTSLRGEENIALASRSE